MRADYFSTRGLAIRLLGGKCPCGVTDTDLLTVDHIHGDGIEARKKYWSKRGCTFVKDLPPSERMKQLQRAIDGGYLDKVFQVFCWNCHHKKTRANNDYKPKVCAWREDEELPLFGRVRTVKPVVVIPTVKPTIEWEKQPKIASVTFTKQDEFEWGT